MNYLGSNRVVTNSFNNHKTAEDYAGDHLSNVIMYGNGKVIKVINKFKSHEDSINYNDFLKNSNLWFKNNIYNCISITGNTTLMSPEELGGNQVFIETYDGFNKLIFRFAHLDSVNVKVGDIVGENTIIGLQGNTGLVLSSKSKSDKTYGSHVHLEIIDENNKYIDPRNYACGNIKTTYVIQSNIRDESKLQFIVNVDVINIRECPDVLSKDIGNVYLNEIYNIYDTITDDTYIWYKIKTSNNLEGYVANLKNNNWVTVYLPKEEKVDFPIKEDKNIEDLKLVFECNLEGYYYIYLKKSEKLYLK